MRLNKLFFLFFSLLLLSSFVSGASEVQDSFNRSDRSLNGDTADNGNVWSVTAGSGTITSNFGNCAYSGGTGACNLPLDEYNSSVADSMNITFKWLTDTDNANQAYLEFKDGSSLVLGFLFRNGNVEVRSSGSWVNIGAVGSKDVFHNMTVVVNFTSETYWVVLDGTTYNNGGSDFTFANSASKVNGVFLTKGTGGKISLDELIYFEVTPPPVPDVNESVENTAVVQQTGVTTINTPFLSTVISSSFEVPLNTSLYGVYTFNAVSASSNTLYCQLDVDGVQRGNVTRSMVAGELGSLTISTPMFNLSSGNYTQSLSCRRVGGGGIVVSNAVGIGHFMYDQYNRSLQFESASLSASTSNGSVFSKVGEFNFSTLNYSVTQSFVNSLLLEWSATYANNGVSSEKLSTYIAINGTNCSQIPRVVGVGSVGSVGSTCVLENVTPSSLYTVSLYARGSNADFTGNIIAKQFYINEEEIVGGTGVLNGTVFSGSSPVLLINVSGGNLNHDSANSIFKLGYSVSANQSTNVSFYAQLVNSQTYTSSNITRFVDVNTGVLIGQDVFVDIPKDNYSILLYASCPDAICTLEGGATTGYISDVISTELNAFNISAFNSYDNSSVKSFNVSNGLTVSTSSGSLLYFSNGSLENLTVMADGFFDSVVLNHNTSNDLNVTLDKSIVRFEAFKLISGDKIYNFTVTDGFVSDSTTNGTAILNLNVSTNLQVNFSNEQGFYNGSLLVNVSSLDNKTVNFTMYDHVLTFYAHENLTGVSLSNFSVNLSSGVYSESFSTSSGSVSFNITSGVNYTSIFSADSYATKSFNHTNISGLTSSYNYSVFAFNSVRINLINESNFNPILQNVTIKTISNDSAVENITDQGFISLELLEPNDYELRFVSSSFNPRSLFITVLNDSTTEIDVYMTEANLTELQVVSVVDTANQVVEGAVVWLQKEKEGEENVFITVQEAKTDFSGETSVFVERDTTVFYRFAVVVDGEAKPIQPTGNLFTGKTSFIPSVTETVQLIINLVGTSTNPIDDLEAIVTNVTWSGVGNRTVNYTFIDGRNTIVGGRLLVEGKFLNSSLNYEVISNQQVNGSFGNINYTIPEINNTIFRITAFVVKAGSESVVYQSERRFEADVIVDKNLGLLYASLIMIVVVLLTVKFGALWSSVATVAILFLTNKIGLTDIATTLVSSFIALAIILFIEVKRR